MNAEFFALAFIAIALLLGAYLAVSGLVRLS